MRIIGHIDNEEQALIFADYLYSRGVINEVEDVASGGMDIWVHNEDQINQARQELERFLADPGAPEYQEGAAAGARLRRKNQAENERTVTTMPGRAGVARGVPLASVAPVTMALIVISVIVTLFGGLGSGSKLTSLLSISSYHVVGHALRYDPTLSEILHGQIWRLVTPVFIHASLFAGGIGFLHLLFNMLWLKDLGGMLESAQGSRGMLVKFLVLAVLSNLAQFFVSGPMFGGMSGVVYGLLGYCWVRGKYDLTSGLYVSGQTAAFMIIWFFLCLAGFMGAIANAAHGAGLVVGVCWGWLDAWIVNRR